MGYILIFVGLIALISGVIIINHKDVDDVISLASESSKHSEIPTNEESSTRFQGKDGKDDVEIEREEVSNVANESITETLNSHSVDTQKTKGDAFEDFVVNLLADWRLKLLDRTQDKKSTAGVVAESSKNPDLHIQQKRGKGTIDYYIECKYRSHWQNGEVSFEEWQLNRYRQFQRSNHRKVIIALGVGGSPSSPTTFRLVPLDSIKHNSIREIDTKFAVSATSSSLVDYIDHYFTSVFTTSKERKAKEVDSEKHTL